MRKAQFFAAATTTFARRELCNPPCSPRFTAARSPPPRQATVFATRRARPRAGRPSRARRAAFGSSSTATAPRRNPAESPGAATTASTTAEDTTAPARAEAAEAAEAARSAAEDAARPAATDTTTTTTTRRIGTSVGTAAAGARFARRDAAGAASTPSEGSAATATEGTGASAFVATIGDTTAATRSRGGTTEFRPDATTTAAGIPSPTMRHRFARRATAGNAVPTAAAANAGPTA